MTILARALLLAAMLSAGKAEAHALSVSYLTMDGEGPGQPVLRVELDLALKDLALTIPLDANRDDIVTWGELVATRETLEDLVMENVGLSKGGSPCVLASTGLATRRYDDGAYATVQMVARCPPGGSLMLDYRLFFQRDPQHRAVVTFHAGDSTTTRIASAGGRRVRLDGPARNAFRDFLLDGIHHILIGYDHLAFLLSLLLPAVLARVRGAWIPAPDLRAGLLQLLSIVTAFTAAHSITLTLAAFDVVRPASRWVEAAIAGSVLLAALNNVKPIVTRRLWLVGFAFGLIHGFGFAGALSELGLPRNARLSSLLGFNLGVEIGQLAVVALVFPLLYLIRRHPWYPNRVMPLASVAMVVLSAWWIFSRLA